MGSKKNPKQNASVRVDIEGVERPQSSAPEQVEGSNNSVVWIVGFFVVLAIGAALFLLRPSEDAAADGTIREAPTTTIPDDPVESSTTESSDSLEAPTLSFPDAALVPVPIETEVLPTSIVAVDNGFLGLAISVSTTPTILRSVDGLDWRLVETTVMSDGVDPEVERRWNSLTSRDGQLQIDAVIADQGEIGLITDIFLSDSGADWQQVSGIGNLDGGPLPERPGFIRGDEYFSLGFGIAEITDAFVRDHTNLSLSGNGACFLNGGDTPGPDGQVEILVRDCRGTGQRLVVDANTVASSFTDDEVLACARILSFSHVSQALVTQQLEGDRERTILDLFIGDLPVHLPSGNVAVVDVGLPVLQDTERCDGIVPISAGTEPSIVLFEEGSNEFVRWPFPEGRDVSSSALNDAAVLGELQRSNSTKTLLIGFDESLWTLDTGTGFWVELHASSATAPLGSFDDEVRISTSGGRVYSIFDGQLVVVNLGISDLATDLWSSASIVAPNGDFDVRSILYADDEVIFVRTSNQVWMTPAPFAQGN